MNEKQLIDFANAIIAQYYDGENGENIRVEEIPADLLASAK